MPETELLSEFDRQLDTLRTAGHPPEQVTEAARLRDRLPADAAGSVIPFVLVVSGPPAEQVISRVELGGKTGFTSMDVDDIKGFTPIPSVVLPDGSAYLITGVDTGQATLNVAPQDGLEIISREDRSPLTLDEGLALAMHFPDVLRSMNCFEMVGSRCGDRRVTGIWVSKNGRPRLGWCWVGNPHSWLGMASCAERVGIEPTVGPRSDQLAVR